MVRDRPSIAGLVCVLAVLASCGREAPEPTVERQEQVVPVGAIVARTGGMRAVVHASGVVVPAEGGEFLAHPPEPARIVDITKSQGDPVASGEILVRFELPSAAQDVSRLAADLGAAQAQLENARISLTRVREFADKGFVPRRDVEIADRELADAQAAVDRTTTAHAAAEAAASRAVVRAPFNGVVATRRYEPGDIVTSSTADAVLRIVDPRRLEVIAEIPETDIARVVPGASARIAGPVDGQPVRLTVAGRLPAGQRIGDALPVRLVFLDPAASGGSENPPLRFDVDARIAVDIDAEERTDAILLPAEAIVREGAQSVVFIAAGSKAERRVVTTGITDGPRVEITTGVKPGEVVITRGHIGLTDGAAINVDVTR
jgi:cobalt-zinc-cadmium efflux system membrane fusion protein